jgi:hypothetical protein
MSSHDPTPTALHQACIRNGLVGGATRPRGHQGRARAGEAGDAMDARGLDGLGQGQRRQDGGEPPRQPRLARPRRAEHQDVMVKTPAGPSALRGHLEMTAANMAPVCAEVGQV